MPWKSKGEPTDFLLDTGNRFLRVDRQKQARRLPGVTTQKEERKRLPEPLTHAATGSRNVSSSDVRECPYSRMGVGWGETDSELGVWVRWLGRTVQAWRAPGGKGSDLLKLLSDDPQNAEMLRVEFVVDGP